MSYQEKIEQELEFFDEYIDVHQLPQAYSYYAQRGFLKKWQETFGYSTYDEWVLDYLDVIKREKNESDIKICSLGSGDCSIEIDFAANNNLECEFHCYEVNQHSLDRAKNYAAEKLKEGTFKFIQCDVNKLKLEQQYDIVLAIHSLHHFVELEHIFDEIDRCMTEKSYFIINDMIGRNGHMFWDNTLEIVNAIHSLFPKELKYNHLLKQYYEKRIQWDCSTEGFEGIRAQDILPLLDTKFQFLDFAPFAAIANKFTEREFGHNFDLDNDFHKSILDMIIAYDDFFLTNKLLKPVQLFATVVKKDVKISNYRYMYFENPAEVYLMDDAKIWDHFDR